MKYKGIFSQDLETNIFDKYVPFSHDAVFNYYSRHEVGYFPYKHKVAKCALKQPQAVDG